MSTHDLADLAIGALNQRSAGDGQGGDIDGTALISRLANELFRAAPGGGISQGIPAPSPLLARDLAVPAGDLPSDLPDLVPGSYAPSQVTPSPTAVPPSLAPQSGASVATPVPTRIPAPVLAPGGGILGAPDASPDYGVPCTRQITGLLADLPGRRTPTDGDASPFYFLQAPPTFAAPAHPGATGHGGSPAKHQGFPGAVPFDVHAVRRDFPILQERVHGRPLIWFDNAATTQKPQVVIDRLAHFYAHENSNIHRAAHELAARSTDAYEGAREIVRRFINASSANEVIFVRGATEGINLVAQSWGRQHVKAGDEIVITWLEHHANIVPWQHLVETTGAVLKVAPVDDDGQIIIGEYEKLLGPKTKLVALTQVSNALGTVTPAQAMVAAAHRVGAKVLVDGAQSVSHLRTDVQALDADWFVFSGHKVFGPTGIGVVYGKEDLLNATDPWQRGGNMIKDVTFEKSLFHHAPGRFEAGTGNIADAVGLGAALEYVERIGIERIAAYEHDLLVYGTRRLAGVPGLRPIGTAKDKASVLSFVLDGFTTEEVGKALDQQAGIAVRSGHHCAQPILRRFGQESTVRPSLAFYNTMGEIDILVDTLKRLVNGKRP